MIGLKPGHTRDPAEFDGSVAFAAMVTKYPIH